jgi:hypothetical protein
MDLVNQTASITVQTAATYTVTTIMQVDVQVYKVQALPLNNSYCSGGKCCKTTVMELLPYQQQLQELYYGYWSTASITVQTAATYTVTTMQVDVQV